jgi:NAD(P)-dependent dehydrogenase (short-subunit alcohol dehydrogenase family)
MSGNRVKGGATTGAQSLRGRIALISGAAQGIGKAIASRFQQAGARVIVLDRDVVAGRNSAAELTRGCPALPAEFLSADLLSADKIRSAVDQIKDRFGGVDVLVNNAGIEIEKSFATATVQDWDCILGINLRGAFLLTQAVLPLFPASGGAIVNVSSIHATHAFPNSLPYACSKAGLVAFTRNLALELAPQHIRVNAVCPGYIDTRLWEEYLHRSPDPAAVEAQTTALHPVGRRGLPADVGEAALFLATEGSSFVTGIDLVVDGGLTIRAHP